MDRINAADHTDNFMPALIKIGKPYFQLFPGITQGQQPVFQGREEKPGPITTKDINQQPVRNPISRLEIPIENLKFFRLIISWHIFKSNKEGALPPLPYFTHNAQ